jgi:hypothetical protein
LVEVKVSTSAQDGRRASAETREIVIPHDPAAGRLTAVRNVLIQASLGQLKAHGHYERYTKLIEPNLLEQLLSRLAPGWIPLDLALAHYGACESLELGREDFEAMGEGVGERVQETMLVSPANKAREADFDLWQGLAALQRVWPRVFKGGSVQIVKVGPKEMLLEEVGFALNQYHYYRQSHLSALRTTYSALGTRITHTKVVSYNAVTDEMVVRVAWA